MAGDIRVLVRVPNDKDKWEKGEKKKAQLNANAIHPLFCALGPNKYNKVSQGQNSKEIWDKLTTIHKGTSQIKFGESYKDMFDRFTNIINELKALGKPVGEIRLRKQFTIIATV
ncbi:UBN2 domain-containing protein [Gossypium australe]|uniref:UBN2 domain-containing protein n=1 Tax=Gossypium australe TaxID=47621 RepID=A0A5B6WSS0_9ROSI|nr:UBN2 domain-containing protein [Gossypium australe]